MTERNWALIIVCKGCGLAAHPSDFLCDDCGFDGYGHNPTCRWAHRFSPWVITLTPRKLSA